MLEEARLKPEYLSRFMIEDVSHPRHRMEIMMKKKAATAAASIKRCCVNCEFELIF